MSKAIVVINMPKSCNDCIFHVLKWHHPFWSREKPSTKGLCCQLDTEKTKRIKELHIDDNQFKPDWCSLKLVKEGEGNE